MPSGSVNRLNLAAAVRPNRVSIAFRLAGFTGEGLGALIITPVNSSTFINP